MTRVALIAGLLVACSGDTETPTTGDTGTTTEAPACGNALIQAYPSGGEVDVFYRTSVDLSLSGEDTSATLTLVDEAGAAVAGTQIMEGTLLSFVPDEPLMTGASYTWDLSWGCAPESASFTVGTQAGDPLLDPSALAGRSWTMDLRQGRYVAPEGIGTVLTQMIEVNLLLGADSADATSVQLSVGAQDPSGGQDVCAATTLINEPADLTDNPFWTVTQEALPLSVAGDLVNITDLTLSGAFTPSGDTIEGVRLKGILNAGDLQDSVGVPNPEDVCSLFSAAYGIGCEVCPDTGEELCITLIIADLTLEENAYGLVPITAADVAGNPDCDSTR